MEYHNEFYYQFFLRLIQFHMGVFKFGEIQ